MSTMPRTYAGDGALVGTTWRRVWLGVLVAVALAFPFLSGRFWLTVVNFAVIAAIGALGLNVLAGYTGQVSLGHAFFLGAGAYTAAYLGGDLHWPFVVWVPAAGVVAALFGALVGPTALRLKGLYLAIVTLGLVFVGNHIFNNLPRLTGGPVGRRIPAPALGGLDFAAGAQVGPVTLSRDQLYYFLVVALLAIAVLFVANVIRTRPGRAFRAVRDRELAAEIVGVGLARTKVSAFILSAFLAGVTGALLASYLSFVIPDYWDLLLSIEYVAMIIIGGVGTILGSLLGAAFIVALPRVIESVSDQIPFLEHGAGSGGISVHDFNTILFGVLIIVFLVFEPDGLAGIYRRAQTYFKAWPFTF
jgi:branched-chain amino acid transport system permease protein